MGTIRRVAVLAVIRRDMATAVRLFAATDALGADLGTIQALPEREIYDRALADAERRLPAAKREAEAARGADLSLEAAVADAEVFLESIDRHHVVALTESPSAAGLSRREREVLRLLVEGASNDEIAAALSVSRRTAAQHVGSILGKLGASNRTAATSIALRRGLV